MGNTILQQKNQMLPPAGGSGSTGVGTSMSGSKSNAFQPGKLGNAALRGKSSSFAASLKATGGPNGPVPPKR